LFKFDLSLNRGSAFRGIDPARLLSTHDESTFYNPNTDSGFYSIRSGPSAAVKADFSGRGGRLARLSGGGRS